MKPAGSKSLLRNEFQQKIESLSFPELVTKSEKLSSHFHQLISQLKVSIRDRYVVSFYPFDSEPQMNIESEKRDEPYQVGYVRITNWGQRSMIAAAARRDQPGEWEEIEIGPNKKVFQPSSNQKICSAPEVSAILVPGLAFTESGERLGRGAGFYDRFLPQYPGALRIGLAFENQMAPSLPAESWDQRVDVILTERQIYEVKSTNHLGEWKSQGKILKRT